MSGDGGGKIRFTRSRTAGTPYDRRKSLFSRVTDTVKDILSPSWLIDIVSTVKKPSSNDTDEDITRNPNDFEESYLASAPGPSGMADTDTGRTHVGPYGAKLIEKPEIYSSPTLQDKQSVESRPPIRNWIRDKGRETVTQEVLVNGGDDRDSEYSEQSSSAAGQQFKKTTTRRESSNTVAKLREEMKKKDKRRKVEASKDTSTSETSAFWSLQEEEAERTPGLSARPQSTARIHNKPSFSISAFGSTLNASNTSFFGNDSNMASPFYQGKTTYGGASSIRRSRLAPSTPYQISRRQMKAKPLNNSSTSSVTSSTARRILETLEKMSTPLSDARKIPSRSTNSMESPISFTPASYRRRMRLVNTVTQRQDLDAPPVHNLVAPRQASIAKNRQSVPTRLVEDKEDNRRDLTSTATDDKGSKDLETGSGNRNSGKMRRERSTQHLSRKPTEEEEDVPIPELPTTFTLPITKMPQFSFGTSLVTSTPASQLVPSANNMKTSTTTKPESPIKTQFQFSSPIQKASPPGNLNDSDNKANEFKFRSPIKVNEDSEETVVKQFTFEKSPSNAVQDIMAMAKPKQKEVSPVAHEDSPLNQPAKELKTGSVMDILGKGASSDTKETSQGFGDKFKQALGVWECDTCLLQNVASADLCIACQSKKPGSGTTNTSQTPKTLSSGFGAQFKPPSGSWECTVCLLQNNGDLSVCVACQTGKVSTSDGGKQSTTSLTEMFKPVSGTWECDVCLIQNKGTDTKCVACQTPNPKSVPLAAPVSEGFGSQFKVPAGNWECDTCMVQNKATVDKCVACTTPKPGLKTVPSNISSAIEPTTFGSSGGLKLGSAGGLQLGSAGGLKLGSAGGLKLGSIGGFELSTFENSASSTITGGFKLDSLAALSKPSSGGFKIDMGLQGGFKIGNPTKEQESPEGLKISETSSSGNSGTDNSALSSGGFSLDQKVASTDANTSEKDKQLTNAPSLLGGFTLPKSTDSGNSLEQAAGGFNFKPVGNDKQGDPVGQFNFAAPTGGFAFKAPDSTQATTVTTAEGLGSTATSSLSFDSQNKTGGAFGSSSNSSTTGPVLGTTTASSSIYNSSLFNFGQTPATTVGAMNFGQAKPTDTSASSFAFGPPANTAKTGLNFGQSTETTSSASSGFTFGLTTTAPPTVSFSQPVNTTTAASTALVGFNFGQPAGSSTAPSVSLNFGPSPQVSTASASGTFTFGQNPVVTTNQSASLNFGQSAGSSTAPSINLNFSPQVTTASTVGNFTNQSASLNFGQPPAVAPTPGGFSFGQVATVTTAAPTTGFSFGQTTTTSAPGGFSFGQTAPATTAAFNFGQNAASTTTPSTGFNFGQVAVAAPVASTLPSYDFGEAVKTSSVTGPSFTFGSEQSSIVPFGGTAPAFGSTATTTGSAAAPGGFNFGATNPAFQFGGTSGGGSTPFQFNSATVTPNEPAAQPAGGFAFGQVNQQQPASIGFSFGGPSAAPAVGGFNFSANPAMNFGTGAAPTFSASPAAPGNPFNAVNTSTGSNAGQRRMRKAVRKFKK